MSWHANGVGSNVINELEEQKSNNSDSAKEIIQKQKEIIELILITMPENCICIVEANGHIDSYGSYQKLETRIYHV